MHLTSIIFCFLFACATYALPVSPNELHQPSPGHKEEISRIDKSIVDFVVRGGHLIAEEPGVFKVYDDDRDFEKSSAVLKVIFNQNDATIRELEGWAERGYLLAYATQKTRSRSMMFLILKTSCYTPPSMELRKAEAWNDARKTARKTAAQLKSPIIYHLKYDSNFSWVKDTYGWYHLELIDWKTPGHLNKIGMDRPLDKIPHLDVPQTFDH
ncbi:hypothetical protein F5887DRAFT_971124 [Amanita rubescens]|nr:hypothetical protein F5887DRAFT_971124 [Amanita rubescens]